MDQTSNPTNPVQAASGPAIKPVSPSKSSRGRAVLLFILALILPPVGLLVLVYILIKKRPIKWLVILALIVGAIAGILIYIELNNIRLTRASRYQYTIDSNPVNSISGIGNHDGLISFDKPTGFQQTYKNTQSNPATSIYEHKNSKGYAAGFIGLSVSDNGQLATDPKYIEGVKYLMSHPTGDNYDKYTGYFSSFVNSFIGSDFIVKLGAPQTFTNGSIKDQAWEFDVTAAAPAYKKLAPLQGDFIYVINGKNFYYFSILTTQDNWLPNSSVWDQVLNSLKTNQ